MRVTYTGNYTTGTDIGEKQKKGQNAQWRFAPNLIHFNYLFHKIRADVFDDIPYFFVFQGLFMGDHTGPFGSILDNPEHLASRNFLHS